MEYLIIVLSISASGCFHDNNIPGQNSFLERKCMCKIQTTKKHSAKIESQFRISNKIIYVGVC